jgi:hypothetical protein
MYHISISERSKKYYTIKNGHFLAFNYCQIMTLLVIRLLHHVKEIG